MKIDTTGLLDTSLVSLDARLGALELLIRNLYVQRFLAQPEPLNAVETARDSLADLTRKIQVNGPDPAINDLLAAEAEEFLGQMFGEIAEIVRHDVSSGSLGTSAYNNNKGAHRLCPPFQEQSPNSRPTG